MAKLTEFEECALLMEVFNSLLLTVILISMIVLANKAGIIP